MKKKLLLNGLLYVIIDKETTERLNKDIIKVAKEVVDSQADLVQLRAKGIEKTELLDLAGKFSSLFKKTEKIFIVNDSANVACNVKANGLHIGSFDLNQKEARTLIGEDAILGKTIHTLQELKNTSQDEVDYLSFGPFFFTKTKQPNRLPLNDKEIKQMVAKSKKVMFAIGGINRYNVESILRYRIKNIAVSSAILKSASIQKEIRIIKKCLRKAS